MEEKHVRKPEWLKIKIGSTETSAQVGNILRSHCLHTICTSGRCPNQAECWSRGTATFMILGNICTRSCRFCNTPTGHPLPPAADEPQKLAESVKLMKLKHAVITSVDRDDLPDQGAGHWAECIRAVRSENPGTTIEVLLPDFQGKAELMATVIDARPDILGHNIETVRRITPDVRSAARYDRSLEVLRQMAASGIPTKSSIMLGLGETRDEILETMDDLRAAGVTIFTLGQYLQPTRKHLPVREYVHPDTFREYKEIALKKGFRACESGPLVRSSYHAECTFRSL